MPIIKKIIKIVALVCEMWIAPAALLPLSQTPINFYKNFKKTEFLGAPL